MYSSLRVLFKKYLLYMVQKNKQFLLIKNNFLSIVFATVYDVKCLIIIGKIVFSCLHIFYIIKFSKFNYVDLLIQCFIVFNTLLLLSKFTINKWFMYAKNFMVEI